MYLLAVCSLQKDSIVTSAQSSSTRHTQKLLDGASWRVKSGSQDAAKVFHGFHGEKGKL